MASERIDRRGNREGGKNNQTEASDREQKAVTAHYSPNHMTKSPKSKKRRHYPAHPVLSNPNQENQKKSDPTGDKRSNKGIDGVIENRQSGRRELACCDRNQNQDHREATPPPLLNVRIELFPKRACFFNHVDWYSDFRTKLRACSQQLLQPIADAVAFTMLKRCASISSPKRCRKRCKRRRISLRNSIIR